MLDTSSIFAEPSRLKALALNERDDYVGSLRLWWTQAGRVAEERSFRKLPPAVVLLEFYRSQALELYRLESRKKEGPRLTFIEREELKRLSKLLREPDAPWSIASLLSSGTDALIISDDPIWERYVGYVRAKTTEAIPESWFGPGEKGKKLKAKALAKEKARKAKVA